MATWMDCCDCRTGKKPGSGSVGNGINGPGLKHGEKEKLSGVGITFVEDSNGALYVKSLVAGGPAAQSNQIQVGDVLCEVNGTDVYCVNPEQIGSLLLGYEGTQVEVGFKRNTAQAVHRVLLVRANTSTSTAAQAPSLSNMGYTSGGYRSNQDLNIKETR